MSSSSERTERYVPDDGDAKTGLEHTLRYSFARPLCRRRYVLDLACGEGYGSAMVAADAERVLGVDIDEKTVASARERYAHVPNVDFQTGDAHSIDAPDASVDCVLAFEMIEHVDDPERVIAEIRRVLRPTGFLLVSTPNAPKNPENLPGANPFHLHAFDERSFDALLAPAFNDRSYLGERVVAAAALWALDGGQVNGGASEASEYEALHAALTGLAPTYLLAVASNDGSAPIQGIRWKVDEEDNLLGERIKFWMDARDAHERERATARELEVTQLELEQVKGLLRDAGKAGAEAQAEVAKTRAAEADLLSEMESARQAASRASEQAEYFRAEVITLRESYESVVKSASWRVTKPLRRVRGSGRPEG